MPPTCVRCDAGSERRHHRIELHDESDLKPGLVYFLIVFGAGFALGLVRVPFLVPALGVRNAELIEMPFMLAVIAWASWRLVRKNPGLGRLARLKAGLFALGLLLAAELTVAWLLGPGTPAEYIASRDPVSGSVYLASLVVFAVAPALWPGGPGASRSRSLRP